MPVSKRVVQRITLAALTLTAVAIQPTNMFATSIPLGGGGVNNESNVVGNVVAVSTNTPCIAFSGVAPGCPGGPTPMLVSGTDPIFGTTGTIKDIGTTAVIPAFKTINLTIPGGPAIFDLLNVITPTGFSACTVATTSGSCSTGIFVLTQTSPSQVSISLSTNEIGYLGSSTTGFTPYIGVFTTQISGNLNSFGCTGPNCADTIGNILLFESGAGNRITSTWSASESPVPTSGVPEPMSLVMLGTGLVGISMFRQRRRS